MQTTQQHPAIPAGAPRLFPKESLYGTFDRVTGLPVAGMRDGEPRYALIPSLFADRLTADIAATHSAWLHGIDIEVVRIDPQPFTAGWRHTVRRAVLELASEVAR